MKKILLFLTLTFAFYNSVFCQWKPDNVPDPKLNGGGYVSDPDHFLKVYTVDSLNYYAKNADTAGYVQIAVVVLKTIGEEVPKDFATTLFNLWKIGDKSKNNGLLILLVMDQRRVEFETGYGIEDVLTDAICYTIQQNYMVPYFKEGNYDEGLLQGVKLTINSVIQGPQSNTVNEDQSYMPYQYRKHHKKFYQTFIGKFYLVLLSLTIIVFVILFIISLFLKDYYKKYRLMWPFTNWVFFIFAPIPFLVILFPFKKLLEKWRNTPRISPSGKLMRKLDEKEDDKFLNKGQIKEEHINSVDYDVWITDDDEEFLILAYRRWGSKYTQCPKCKFRTYYLKYDRITRAATQSRSGRGEKLYQCENCGHTKHVYYTLPALGTNSSSSGSYRSGSSSFSGGGSSWGGGSSGGGGAGSSW